MKKPWHRLLTKSLIESGDILGCSGFSFQSDFINVVTYGIPRYHLSHLMIICDGLIFESTTQSDLPCALRGIKFNGTQAHYIGSRVASYQGSVWHYPLSKKLRSAETKKLYHYLVANLGKPYDSLGATRSGGKIWSIINRNLHAESHSALFCSEWVAAALQHIERFDTRSTEWSPNALIRELTSRGTLTKPRRLK